MKIAIVQPNYVIGDLNNNYIKNIAFVDRAKQNECDLIIFPEMAISGYPPLDLIDDKEFMEQQYHFIDKLSSYSNEDIGIIFGAIMPNKSNNMGKDKYNAGIFALNGKHKSVAVKQNLPTYNIFDEYRYFEPGKDVCIIEHKDMRFGVLICEDIWAEENNMYDNNPIEKLFRRNDINDRKLDFIVSINASPSEQHKLQKRRDMLSRLSQKYDTNILYVNSVGANDDIVFDGNSMVYSKGHRNITLSSFQEDYQEIIIHQDGNIDIDIIEDGSDNFIPHIETKDNDNMEDCELFYNHIVLGIRDYINKLGFEKVVIGESGGIDSALTTALAVDALGKDNVIAITMPSGYSSEGSYKDSEILCDNLGVKLYNHPIKDIYDLYISKFKSTFGEYKSKLTKENLQARIRANILMEYSNDFGALLLSTSNKSESSVGYCTYLGDMSGGMSPLADLYKGEVWELSRWYNEKHGKEIIPNIIINKEPSAELSPNQKDTDSLPPYQLLDIILKIYIEGYLLDKKELDNYHKILYNSGIPQKEIKRVLNMVDHSEFKRRQAPPGIRCHKRSFGSGRRLPIVQKFEREGKI
jgi:NAD+ synthetase